MKDITIVLVNLMMKNDILSAVESIINDTRGSNLKLRVTVVDNSCNADNIKQALFEKYPMVCYLDPGTNIGFGRANTYGFQITPARYYFALNRDTFLQPGKNIIEKIVKFMDKNPQIGCIGPKLLNIDGSLQYSCYRFDLPSILIKPIRHLRVNKRWNWARKLSDKMLMKDFDHQVTRPVDWLLGAALVVRHEVVEDIGWFDDRYFAYMEDCDWCKMMWEKGWPVYYVHDIVIKHRHARESSRIPGIARALLCNKNARIHLYSWLKYLWKWRGRHKYYGEIS